VLAGVLGSREAAHGLHLVGLTRNFVLRMHGHTNIKYEHQCLVLSMLQSSSCDEPVFGRVSQSCEIRLLASSCPPVCPSVSARLPLKVKFRIGDFYENLSRKSRLC